jgi:hypothetical protein
VRERGPDALEVQAAVVGHHPELVGRREADVAPGVREQLGELGLLRREVDDLVGEPPEQPAARSRLPVVAGADQLGERVQLGHRLALGDALGQNAMSIRGRCPRASAHLRRDAGVDGAAEHEQLAVAEVGGQASSARGIARGSGLRCSSTGVPMTTTTFSASATTAGSVVA